MKRISRHKPGACISTCSLRPIHFALSNTLSVNQGATWRAHANSWRISEDVEAYLGRSSYPLTEWKKALSHFQLVSQWTHFGGPGGWNDLDSLEIGNGRNDGVNGGAANLFTENERQSLMTYWCIAAAPLILGSNLAANLDRFDLGLLRNDESIAIDQAGVPGAPIADYLNSDPNGTKPEIWRSRQPDGTYAVVVTNPSGTAQKAMADWTVFGLTGDVIVRDLWNRSDLMASPNTRGGYRFSSPVTFALDAYQSKFLKITPLSPVAQYLADAKVNRLSGSASLVARNTATDGLAVSNVRNGGAIHFEKVNVPETANYQVGFLYFNGDSSRLATITANQEGGITVSFPGTGSFTSLGMLTQQLMLDQGENTITISAPDKSDAPDVDSIVVAARTTQYLGDAARLEGSAMKIIGSSNCTDGHCVTGVSKGNLMTFPHVRMSQPGEHRISLLYLSDTTRSAEISANNVSAKHVDFPPTSGSPGDNGVVGAVVVELLLREGDNTITISKANGAAPDFDSIIVAE